MFEISDIVVYINLLVIYTFSLWSHLEGSYQYQQTDFEIYQSLWCQTRYDITTYDITTDANNNISFEGLDMNISITTCPNRLDVIAILVLMSVSTLKTAVILYIYIYVMYKQLWKGPLLPYKTII